MHLLHQTETFSDVFAQKDNFVTGIEARTKLAFTVLALAINLLATSIYTPICFICFSLITLLLIRVSPRLLLLRLAMPLVMASVILITQLFYYGKTPLFTISLLGFPVVGYEEGFTHGLLIMARVLGGVSLVLLLSLSTPADKLFRAAAWFRFSRTLIEIALLVYRYIFVLLEEMDSIREAQRVRLGYRGWHRSMKSLAMLGAGLILRAFDRSERVFQAMLVRGYTGNSSATARLAFERGDGLAAALLGLLLAGFYLAGRVGA